MKASLIAWIAWLTVAAAWWPWIALAEDPAGRDGAAQAESDDAAGNADADDDGKESDEDEAAEAAEESPWRLFACCAGEHDDKAPSIRGWLAGGITFNGDRPADRFNGPTTFNDRSSEGQLSQLCVILEDPVQTDADEWDLGGRIDLVYGGDYRFTLTRGFDARDDYSPKWGSGRFYGLALPQAYAELGGYDWSVKIGHFYTPLGYETIASENNFFYSHSYSAQYAEPATHTGALATYAIDERLSVSAGIINGWDTFGDQNHGQSFLGGATLTGEDEGDSLGFTLTSGREIVGDGDHSAHRTALTVLGTAALGERWQYVFQHDAGWQAEAADDGANWAQWYSLVHYLTYEIDDHWSAGGRLEWFRDDDGYRVTGFGDGNAIAGESFEGNFWAITLGLNWKPTANFVLRPEVRYDWFDGTGSNGGLPYDAGTDDDQLLFACDAILHW